MMNPRYFIILYSALNEKKVRVSGEYHDKAISFPCRASIVRDLHQKGLHRIEIHQILELSKEDFTAWTSQMKVTPLPSRIKMPYAD